VATRFEPLALGDDRLFGVRIHGAFGRGDRQRLLDLAERCLAKDKTRLVLDCANLDSLGGGGATVLADLQRQLVERGGEAVFVSVGQVIRRFLQQKFTGLPLRLFESVPTAAAALATDGVAAAAVPADAPEPAAAAVRATAPSPPAAAVSPSLDVLLDEVEPSEVPAGAPVRRTADLVTAVYVSLDDALLAAAEGNNPTVFAETLANLLDSHDLATETAYCYPRDEHYVAADGRWRLPAEGGIVRSLLQSRRPLTLLDLEEGALWDEETQLLEDLQPDLILPFVKAETLTGIAFLQRGGAEREYGLAEIFALELFQRLVAGPVVAAPREPSEAVPAVTAPAISRGAETLLGVKLELARGLQDAQDIPHFWQIFTSRLRLAAEVTSLVYLGSDELAGAAFLMGEARRGLTGADLDGERIRTFFRTLERPVEIANMPASFKDVRDVLASRGLQWVVGLRTEDQPYLGMIALGLRWRCRTGDALDQIHELMEITGEALLRLRENQHRADMSLGLLEQLLVGDHRADLAPDLVTRETARAVRLLARELGLPPDQERDLVLGALLRNHGQEQGTFDDRTADRLQGQQWETFRAHPDLGERRLAALNAPTAVRDAVRHHHERFDGRGFPLGLKGRDIPLGARLVAVAQLYAQHVVTGDSRLAQQAVQQEAGRSLDPDLVEIFAKAVLRQDLDPVPA